MATQQTGAIYTLTDPRDGRIRYVGKTTQDPMERLAGHLKSASNPVMRVWFHALALQGLTPRIDTIDTPLLQKLDAEEQRQIEQHAKAGHRLFNAPYYHHNIADLYQHAAPTPEALKRDDVIMRKVDDYAHRMYGEIAAASAAGKISRNGAAGQVLVRMPAVALVFLWHLACSIPPLRWGAKASIWVWGLWMVGFNRLAHDKVLPYLPLREAEAFWYAYLARPLTNIGLTLVGAALFMALIAYWGVRESAGAQRPKQTASPRGHLTPAETAAAAAAALDAAVPSPLRADLLKHMEKPGNG